MQLPWFILDEIIANVDYPLLLEVRLVNRHINETTKKRVFERFGFKNPASSFSELEYISKYSGLCRSISLPSFCGEYRFLDYKMIPEVFSTFSQAHSLRVYLANGMPDICLDLMCQSAPKLKHLSVYYVRNESRLKSLASLTELTSLTICYASDSFQHYMLRDCSFPHLKKLAIVLMHHDLHLYEAEIHGEFPKLAYFHTLGRLNGKDYSFFEVDIGKSSVLSIGKYSLKKKRILSFRFAQGHHVDLLPLNSDSLSASYRNTALLLKEFLKSESSPLLFKGFFYNSHRWRIERSKPFKLPHVDSITIDVVDLNEIRKPVAICTTTRLSAQKFTILNPAFIQWLINFFPYLNHLDIHDFLDDFGWRGEFPSLETLKTKKSLLTTLLRFLDAAPKLKFLYSNISKETATELVKHRPSLCICPYRSTDLKEKSFLSEYDDATFGIVDPLLL